jgi:hypothetical protein
MINEGEIVALAQTFAMKVVRAQLRTEGEKIGEVTAKDIRHRARFLIRTDPWYGQLAKSVIEAVLKHGEAKR